MLQIENGIQIATDDYYVQHKEYGEDELHFEVQISDPVYLAINEETRIYESTEHQTYVVKTVSGGKKTAKIGGQLDLTDWKAEIDLNYNRTGTAVQFLNGFKPSGWTVADPTPKTATKTIKLDAPTPLDLALRVQEDFGCRLRFDTAGKTVTIIYPDDVTQSNSYAVDTVNLVSAPEYKGKSSDLYTRIYPRGKNGLTIASVNSGVTYLDTEDDPPYTDRVICKTVDFNEISSAAELKTEAQKTVNAASRPERSWKLKIVDLYRINPQKWQDMQVDIFTKLRLSDTYKGFTATVQVVEDKFFPHYPEKNEVTISTVTKSVQRSLHGLIDTIYNPNSRFNMRLKSR
ncbi:MAG: phage tail protein [Oscillospiraceae bacterium]|nr:phage tail protein [Oscillospiraceae bacterium]